MKGVLRRVVGRSSNVTSNSGSKKRPSGTEAGAALSIECFTSGKIIPIQHVRARKLTIAIHCLQRRYGEAFSVHFAKEGICEVSENEPAYTFRLILRRIEMGPTEVIWSMK